MNERKLMSNERNGPNEGGGVVGWKKDGGEMLGLRKRLARSTPVFVKSCSAPRTSFSFLLPASQLVLLNSASYCRFIRL